MEKDTGVDYSMLACRAAVLTPYVREHLSRAAQEIEGLYNQLPSIVDPEDIQRTRWEDGRESYVDRICEAIQHLGKALTALGCADSELEKILLCKEDANQEEIDTSSDGREEEATGKEIDGGKTIVMTLPEKARTEIPESGNQVIRRVNTPPSGV